jgi:cAMP-dependent protein kinase regulator
MPLPRAKKKAASEPSAPLEPAAEEEAPRGEEAPREEAAEEEAPASTEPDYGMVEIPSEEEPSAEAESEPAEPAVSAEEEEGLPVEAGDTALPEEGPVHTPLFSDLQPEELTRVFDMLRSVTIPSGVAICREGDQGDSIFVIAEGTVKVSRKGTDGSEIHLTNLGPGDFFGEFGYFANSIRQATVKAYTEVQLLEISREDMDKVVEEFPRIKDVMLKFYRERVLDNLLALSPLFQGIGQRERLKLIERFELRQIEPGEVIVKEGEMGDSMYLIKSGRVEVATINPVNKGRTILAQLENGDFFGEVSLIKNKPRTASVSAKTPVELMVIKRDQFEELAGEYPELKQVLEDTIERRVEATIEKMTRRPKAAV